MNFETKLKEARNERQLAGVMVDHPDCRLSYSECERLIARAAEIIRRDRKLFLDVLVRRARLLS